MAGLLHRNVITCGFTDTVQRLIRSSVAASILFQDDSLTWVHIDARHDYDSVSSDIAAWAPKVASSGWLSGDDYDAHQWPGVTEGTTRSGAAGTSSLEEVPQQRGAPADRCHRCRNSAAARRGPGDQPARATPNVAGQAPS